jgi:isoamylase
VHDIEWFDERAQPLSPEDWNNPEGRALTMRRAERADGEVRLMALLLNASPYALAFTPPPGRGWRLLIDSAAPEASGDEITGEEIMVQERAVVLLMGAIRAEGG